MFIRNKLQWNFNKNIIFLFHDNASENIFCEMAAILSRGRWANITYFREKLHFAPHGQLAKDPRTLHLIAF